MLFDNPKKYQSGSSIQVAGTHRLPIAVQISTAHTSHFLQFPPYKTNDAPVNHTNRIKYSGFSFLTSFWQHHVKSLSSCFYLIEIQV